MGAPAAPSRGTMLTLLLSMVGAVSPPPTGHVVTVNDSVAIGVVGDSRLSLDEAIRLANGTLSTSQLSRAELGQIAGSGPGYERIVVDAAMVPAIAYDGSITPIAASQMLMIEGMADASGRKPRLDVGSHPAGFAFRNHMVMIMNFQIVGGAVAVEGTTTMGSMTSPARLMGLDVSGQSSSGYHFHANGAVMAFVHVMDGTLRNLPVGFDLDDNAQAGAMMIEGERLAFDGVQLGVDMLVNSSGDTSMAMWWRSTFVNGDTFARVRRGAGSAQRVMLRIVHCVMTSRSDLSDVQGNDAETIFHHHHSRLTAPAGRKLIWVHPKTARFDVHGSEMDFYGGDVSISSNRFTRRIWQHNNVYHGGRILIDNDGVPPDMMWNRFEGTVIDVAAASRTPFSIVQGEFYGATVVGNSVLGALTLDRCYLSSTTTQQNVTVQNAAPTPWLSVTGVSDAAPPIGGAITLASWSPPGIGLIWDIGLTNERPVTTAFPFRFYAYEQTYQFVTGVLPSGLQLVPVQLPNDPGLVGVEFYLQGVAVPTQGQAHVPPISLPTGSRVIPR